MMIMTKASHLVPGKLFFCYVVKRKEKKQKCCHKDPACKWKNKIIKNKNKNTRNNLSSKKKEKEEES